MKIFNENLFFNRAGGVSLNTTNGKGKFAYRLSKAIGEIDNSLLTFQPWKANVILSFNRMPIFNLAHTIVRLDDVYFYDDPMQIKIYKNGLNNVLDSLNNANGIVYQSKIARRIVEGVTGLSPRDSTIIYNGVPEIRDDDQESTIVEQIRTKWPGSKVILLPFEKLFPQRRIEPALETLIGHLTSLNWVVLCVGGSQVDADMLLTQFRSERVYALPKLQPLEFYAVLSKADCCVSLKYQDSCPNLVGEALALKTPVVVSSTNGWQELELSLISVANIDSYTAIRPLNMSQPPSINWQVLIPAIISALQIDKKEFHKLDSSLSIRNIAGQYVDYAEKILATQGTLKKRMNAKQCKIYCKEMLKLLAKG